MPDEAALKQFLFRGYSTCVADASYDPLSEDFADDMPRLNSMINLWQTQGLKLWLQSDLNVGPLIAGTSLYTIGVGGTVNMTKPLRVVQGYYLDSSSNQRPVYSISREEYNRLSNVTTQGAINSYFVQKNQLNLSVYLWMNPDTQAATGQMHAIIQQQVTNFTSLSDDMNFPVEWFSALYWGLANEICSGQPQAIMDRCARFAASYRAALDDWDVEDAATQFQPDQRATMWNTGFR